MTKRHFIAIAAILSDQWHNAQTAEARLVTRNTTIALADMFDKDNPRFNRPEFYQAVFGDFGMAIL